MGKRILSLYVDDVTINQAKALGINISQFLTSALEMELQITRAKEGKDAIIEDLKLINTRLSETNKNLKKELENIKSQMEKAKKKADGKVLKSFSIDTKNPEKYDEAGEFI